MWQTIRFLKYRTIFLNFDLSQLIHRTLQKHNGNHISGEEPASVFLKNWFKKRVIQDLNSLGSKSAKEFVEGFGFQLYEVGLIPNNADFLSKYPIFGQVSSSSIRSQG